MWQNVGFFPSTSFFVQDPAVAAPIAFDANKQMFLHFTHFIKVLTRKVWSGASNSIIVQEGQVFHEGVFREYGSLTPCCVSKDPPPMNFSLASVARRVLLITS